VDGGHAEVVHRGDAEPGEQPRTDQPADGGRRAAGPGDEQPGGDDNDPGDGAERREREVVAHRPARDREAEHHQEVGQPDADPADRDRGQPEPASAPGPGEQPGPGRAQQAEQRAEKGHPVAECGIDPAVGEVADMVHGVATSGDA
jgi:hypothetical protein